MSTGEDHLSDDNSALDEDEEGLLDAEDAAEEIDDDPDHPMEDDEEDIQEEIQFVNDSAAHFDAHTSSIFCIAQHPLYPNIVATGGGDDIAYVFDASIPDGPLLPSSYESEPHPRGERKSIVPLQKLEGHSDSVNAIAYTLPKGEYLFTAGLDGKIKAYMSNKTGTKYLAVAEAQEVQEVNWLAACPNPDFPNTVALGANDGSVWVYSVNAQDKASPLNIVQVFYLHTESCTAGSWSPDGKLLATVSEDGSFHVWDVFGSGQAVVSLTADDQRFAVEGGLYSVAMTSSIAAVGGAGGNIKIVGLPQTSDTEKKNKSKSAGAGAKQTTASSTGQILASLQAHSDGVETLSFSEAPLNLLASGSVDGSIALYDTAHRFAVRRHIKEAHEETAVVKVEFVKSQGGRGGHILTSCGLDGVVRRWDARGGTTAAGQGFLKEWKGHIGIGEGLREEGEGEDEEKEGVQKGGVLGFVQGGGGARIVTAGDDHVSLVFRADLP